MKFLTFSAALFLVSCGKPAPTAAPPPLPVTVAKPDQREVVVYKTFPASLTGAAEIEIRARVPGVLARTDFSEGAVVDAGRELFVIEPEPFELAVTSAQASLERALAARDLADKKYERISSAGRKNAVSQIDVEIANAELAQAAAGVSQAEAALQNAKIDLGYTRIAAPVTGRMSEAMVDAGNLVGVTERTLLATITDDSNIRAYFEVPERNMIKFLGERALEGGVERFADKKLRLELADGSVYSEPGVIDFIDNRIDTSTRTARIRAIFPNPKSELSSGLYGLVGFPAGPDPDDQNVSSALLVPSTSVQRDLGGDFVWIVDDENVVHRRGVETGDSVEPAAVDPGSPRALQTVILKGLDGSEDVIVAGLQRARDGATVAAQRAEPSDSEK